MKGKSDIIARHNLEILIPSLTNLLNLEVYTNSTYLNFLKQIAGNLFLKFNYNIKKYFKVEKAIWFHFSTFKFYKHFSRIFKL